MGDTYTVTWSYETAAQGMTPQQAAELAATVFHDGDPIAGPGKVEMTVTRVSGGTETNLGEFIVEHGRPAVTPDVEREIRSTAAFHDILSGVPDDEPPECPADGDVGYPGGEPGLWLCSSCGREIRT